MTAARTLGLVGAVVVLVVAAAVAVLLLRPAVRESAGAVTIECAASVGLEPAACADWGRRTLEDGVPSNTFELKDVARVSLERGLLGFGPTCRARWFVERYPNDPVWEEEVACP